MLQPNSIVDLRKVLTEMNGRVNILFRIRVQIGPQGPGSALWTTPKPSSPIVIRLTGDRLYSNAAWPGYVINTEMGDELSNPDQPIIIGIVLIPTVLVPSSQSQT